MDLEWFSLLREEAEQQPWWRACEERTSPEAVTGVINFVGGWMSEGCVPDSNGRFLRDEAKTAAVPMLWSYAEHDHYDSATAIRH
jgi:hypothetical protein